MSMRSYGQYPSLLHLVLDELEFLYKETSRLAPGTYRAAVTIQVVKDAIAEQEQERRAALVDKVLTEQAPVLRALKDS